MKKLLDPAYWGRALRNPKVLAGLAIDLVPIYAVLAWGWGAAPLVLLYWIENLIAGVMTIPRIFISGATYGVIGIGIGLFMSVFFVFHYGLFCAGHGTFLMVFAGMANGGIPEDFMPMDIPGMVRTALESGQHMIWVVALLAVWQFLLLVWDFGVRGEWRDTNPMAEMFAPYGRIVVLHIALFAGMAGLLLLGQPMLGVLGLIVLRALWGVTQNSKNKGDVGEFNTPTYSREQFAAMLRGEKPPEV
jgi:hypothetical protein